MAENTNFSDGLVVLDFWAPWCGPCKAIKPLIEEVEKERKDVKVYKINIEEDVDEISREFKVRSIPTIIVLENGEEKGRLNGTTTKELLLRLL